MLKNNSIGIKKSNSIKVLAILFMLIDHIGAVFFPYKGLYRIIGRLAFPLFAYQLTIGYKNTSNINQYLKRLWIFALISQIPYTLLFDTTNLNIYFTLFLGLFLLEKLDKKSYYWIPSLLIISELLNVDYGSYGLLLIVLLYSVESNIVKAIGLILLSFLYSNFTNMADSQVFSVLAIAIISISNYLPSIKINKTFIYWFYPLHLALLLIVKLFLIY